MAMVNVPSQLTTPATAIASGRGPWRNSSAPIIIGIGPAITHFNTTCTSTSSINSTATVLGINHAYWLGRKSSMHFWCSYVARLLRYRPNRNHSTYCIPSGMAETTVVKRCTEIGYIKSYQTDDMSPLKGALLWPCDPLNFLVAPWNS